MQTPFTSKKRKKPEAQSLLQQPNLTIEDLLQQVSQMEQELAAATEHFELLCQDRLKRCSDTIAALF